LLHLKERHLWRKLLKFIAFIFFFLGLGYSLIPYEKSRVTDYRRKQNGFVFLFLLYGTVTSLFAMVSANTTISYAEQFQDFEATRNLPIIQMGFDQMKGLITSAVIFTLSSPLVASSFSVLNSLIGYATNGIKGVVVSNLIVFLSIVQFIYGRISISKMSLIFPIALIGLIGLIATTGFRNRLGFDSLIELNANQMSEYLSYFPNSPELRQLEFTSRLLEFLEEGKTETRYGWDYFRFFFYPVKYLFEDFQYASYNEFAHLFYSEKINAGLYLGLGGELYWNFSYLFFVFSGIIGGLLKIYQNSIGQFGQMGLFFFFSLHHSILWYLYRGAANMLIMETFFVLLLISLYFLIRKIFNENKYKDAILNFLIDSSRINCSKYPESEKDIRK